jgi:hemin uptake protein HemP
MREDPALPEPADEEPADPHAPVLDAQQIFHGCREVWIDHEGVRYRLRITRRNRLILQK